MSLFHQIAFFRVLAFVLVLASFESIHAEPVYELRVYTCEPGKLDALNERFQNDTIRIFAKHGMENVAYWIPADKPKSSNTLVYLLRHQSRDAAKKSWDAFRIDPEWKQVAGASREKYGKILATAPYSTYMVPTDYSPKTGHSKLDRLYELRIYTAADGKLEALHDRFRRHTDKLFTKHGMKSVGYWSPMDSPQSGEMMIYALEHQDLASAKASWRAFSQDPVWQAARKASEVDGGLLAKRPERLYMKPTAYTPVAP